MKPNATSKLVIAMGFILAVFSLPICALEPVEKWMSEKYCCPLFSPDGRYLLAEGVVPPRNSEIFLMRADGSEVRNVTQHPADDGAPAWSPDGRAIFFKSDREGEPGERYAYYRMNLDGSGVAKIVSDVALFSPIDWSPDGARIVFHGREGIATCAADGTHRRTLAAKGSHPVLSPDGKWILYWTWKADEMRAVSLDGSHDRLIAKGHALAWTPDGKAIFYVSPWEGQNKPRHVYRIDADGKNQRMVLENVQFTSINHPRRLWNPAGDLVALAVEPAVAAKLHNGIVILDREGNIVRDFRKADKFLYGGSLSWSPDGKTVAYDKFYIALPGERVSPGYPGGIYLLNVETAEVKQLIANKEITIDPRHPPW
jgi:hypothetical protein